MSAFVSVPANADAQPPEPRPPENVANDGFWPDIDILQLRDAVRLDTTIAPQRLRDAVVQAMLDLGRQLQAWRDLNAADADNLHAVTPRRQIDGVSDYVHHYTRAVYSLVGADLGERLLSQSATAAGDKRSESLASEITQHRRNARWAVADFLGKRRAVCELI